MEVTHLLSTIMFAAEAHKDQRRKGSGGAPYINHLIEVAMLLSKQANVKDLYILQSGILHDILEDTKVSEAELIKQFGQTVTSYVKALTDDKTLSLEVRRQKQIDTIENAGREIKLIKLADHCSNIASIPDSWSLNQLEEYLTWSKEIATKCFDCSKGLETEYLSRFSLLEKLKPSF